MTTPSAAPTSEVVGRSGGGVVPVAAGLAVFGLATYGYLAFAGRGLPPEAFAPLSVMWTLLNALGIGLFQPFEQELGRTTASRRAAGHGNAPVVRAGLAGAGALLLVVVLVCVVATGALTQRLFAGYGVLVPLFALAMAGMALAYVVRGLLGGNERFGSYGAQLAVDGVLRVAAAAALERAGVTDVAAYGLVLVAAPVVAVLVTTPRPGKLVSPGPPHGVRLAAGALGTLVVASVLSQALANAGPVVVQLLAATGEETASGQFTAALVIARVPLFAFAAVQAVLLPGLAALVGARDVAGYRRRVRLVLVVTGALGLGGTAAVWWLGPPVVRLMFGEGFDVTREVITLIALSGALFMLAQAAAQALLALRSERWLVAAWGAGLAGLLAALLWQGDLELRAAWSLVAGAGVALVVLGSVLAVQERSWARRTADRS